MFISNHLTVPKNLYTMCLRKKQQLLRLLTLFKLENDNTNSWTKLNCFSPDLPQGADSWVLQRERLPVTQAGEDGQVRGFLRLQLLPRSQEQATQSAVNMQRRHALHQGRRDRAQVCLHQEVLLTIWPLPLHSRSFASCSTLPTADAASLLDHDPQISLLFCIYFCCQ